MKKKQSYRIIRLVTALLFWIVFGFAFIGIVPFSAKFMHCQFGPAAASLIGAFSFGAVTVVLSTALLTLIFGRFYCAVFCPLGILQDVVINIFARKKRNIPNLTVLRYIVCAVVYGLLFAGWNVGFWLLEPYTLSGRFLMMSSAAWLIVPLILLLAAWKKRLFCVSLCPVGTVLGLLAKVGVYRLRLTEKCVKCSRCAAVCPTGCVDVQKGTLDNERCVRCMDCIAACPVDAITFKRMKKESAFDLSRRKFLQKSGMIFAGGIAAGTLAGKAAGKLEKFFKTSKILPPGAGNVFRFDRKCSACQLCAANCPSEIIVADLVSGKVSLDLNKGVCRSDCNLCSQLCPVGALKKLSPEQKKRTKIASAIFLPENCIVFQSGEDCGLCSTVCPAGAITLRRSGAPKLNGSRCIGCGACMDICPGMSAKAFRMEGVEEQSEINLTISTK